MKKTILLFLAILFALSASGQVVGDGRSPLTAYYGTLNSSTSWTVAYNGGTIYVGQGLGTEDLTIGTGGRLTIDPGVKVVFCTQTSDLIITNSGQVFAGGNGSPVTFTRYSPIYNYWGHINFSSTAGPSNMNNCVIEYGDVTRNTAPASYGGGLFVDFNNLNISNCVIRNNRAEWGGGIFVNQNKNTTISTCYFQQNFSNQGGGGIYFWNNSISVVQNCIFDTNHCNGTTASWYTGGGIAAQSYCSVKVLNCTFVNNTSNRVQGQSIMFYSSVNDVATNCIFWGIGNHYYSSGTNSFTYCAGQTSVPAGTGNFVLNSLNNAVDGPNFVAIDGSNWAIKYTSPCRNAGTSTGAPTTDFLGKTRILPYDIGAYEFLSSLWKITAATTDWTNAANWDGGVPTSINDVIIPTGATNYPISTPAPNFTLGSGYSMTLGPGAKTTLGSFTNNGTLTLQADAANGSASFIAGSYSGNDADVQLYLTGGQGTFGPNWHYISSPFASLNTNYFTVTTSNLAHWVESMASINLMIGYVAYDGYVYRVDPPSGPYTGTGFSGLVPGKGYNHYFTANHNYTLQGQLTTSNVTQALSYTADEPARYGLNLLGNPFSSGLDWDQIANNAAYPANTSKGIYFNKSGGVVYYINGVGSEIGVTGVVPPMQGFFTKTYEPGHSISIPSTARVHGTVLTRYKGGETVIPLVRINISSGGFEDNTVLRFDEAAKTDLDYDFDAMKLFISETKPYIYSVSAGTKYAINGQPYPETELELPLVVNLTTTGNHTISSSQLQGLDEYQVTLIDNTTGFNANLKTTPVVTFSSAAGLITDRFILKVGNITTGSEDIISSKGVFNIYSSFGNINIQTLADEWDGKTGSVSLLDLTGKTINATDNNSFSKTSLITLSTNVAKGMYLVEIRAGVRRYVGKVVVR